MMYTTSAAKKAAGRRRDAAIAGTESCMPRSCSILRFVLVSTHRDRFAQSGREPDAYLMTSVARLSPRMISTVGARWRGDSTVTGCRASPSAGATRCAGAPRFAQAEQHRRPDAGGRRRALIERVAQRELNLAFGARQREALGLLRRRPRMRHDRDLHRLALLLVLLDARAGGQHLHVGQHDLRGRVLPAGSSGWRSRRRRRACPAARSRPRR